MGSDPVGAAIGFSDVNWRTRPGYRQAGEEAEGAARGGDREPSRGEAEQTAAASWFSREVGGPCGLDSRLSSAAKMLRRVAWSAVKQVIIAEVRKLA